jgi:hypothetical protein
MPLRKYKTSVRVRREKVCALSTMAAPTLGEQGTLLGVASRGSRKGGMVARIALISFLVAVAVGVALYSLAVPVLQAAPFPLKLRKLSWRTPCTPFGQSLTAGVVPSLQSQPEAAELMGRARMAHIRNRGRNLDAPRMSLAEDEAEEGEEGEEEEEEQEEGSPPKVENMERAAREVQVDRERKFLRKVYTTSPLRCRDPGSRYVPGEDAESA